MEKRLYLEGKCILSYDMSVFASDEQYRIINEVFIDPIRDRVFEKYYEKTLICGVLEKVFKKNAKVYQAYCNIKPLIENEEISEEYICNDDTLLNICMKENLDSDEIKNFEELLNEVDCLYFKETMDFLADDDNMKEHVRVERV